MSEAYRRIGFEEAHRLMEQEESFCFFDVREEDEYITGHARGAELFPLGTIDEDSAEERIPAKDTPLFLYCRSGARSRAAANKLLSFGYRRVYDLGGLNGWPYGTE